MVWKLLNNQKVYIMPCRTKHPRPATLPMLLDVWRGWSHLGDLRETKELGAGVAGPLDPLVPLGPRSPKGTVFYHWIGSWNHLKRKPILSYDAPVLYWVKNESIEERPSWKSPESEIEMNWRLRMDADQQFLWHIERAISALDSRIAWKRRSRVWNHSGLPQ
jgi:hypothetical protein